jgi:glycosyltransferase involved in cell wall biosynthesis
LGKLNLLYALKTMKTEFKIIINGRFLSRSLTGVDRFAFETLTALNKLIEENSIDVLDYSFSIAVPVDGPKQSPFEYIPISHRGKTKGLLWEQFELPCLTIGKYLINLCNAAPLVKVRQLVVIHDAAPVKFPSTFSRFFRIWYRIMMPVIGKLSDQVLTVSEFSKQEIAIAYGIPIQKISVISESGAHILRFTKDDSILDRYGLKEKPFMLAVSSMAPHKNFKIIFEAFKLLQSPGFDLVIAGGANPQVFASTAEPLPDFVKHVGYVGDAELKSLMCNANWFIFSSLYEGFGIPPLEAMNCSCPVLVANAASIPEVCADAALYFDPLNAGELAELLTKAAESPELRKEYVTKGLARCAEFSWELAAKQLVTAISKSHE